jgi:hypothetical protein
MAAIRRRDGRRTAAFARGRRTAAIRRRDGRRTAAFAMGLKNLGKLFGGLGEKAYLCKQETISYY